MIFREFISSGVVAEKKGEKFERLSGSFIEADRKNLNNRLYPAKIVEAMITEAQKRLEQGTKLFGMLGHPRGAESILGETSHLIDKLELKGKLGYFSSKILDTIKGLTLRKLLEAGAKLGVSLRAHGEVKVEEGVEVVKEDCKLISIDMVESPSFEMFAITESAVLYESQQFNVLSEEEILWQKYCLAEFGGYKKGWEEFCLYEKNKDIINLFAYATESGYEGSFSDFVKLRRK